MIKFQPGLSYSCQHFTFECVAVTPKTVVFSHPAFGTKRVKIQAWYGSDDQQCALPLGRYSMAPVVRAEEPCE